MDGDARHALLRRAGDALVAARALAVDAERIRTESRETIHALYGTIDAERASRHAAVMRRRRAGAGDPPA